jgi:hypothetical protein
VRLPRTVAPEQQDEGRRTECCGYDADGKFTVGEQEAGACVGDHEEGCTTECGERGQPSDGGVERQPDEVGDDEADEGDGACEGDGAGNGYADLGRKDEWRVVDEHARAEGLRGTALAAFLDEPRMVDLIVTIAFYCGVVRLLSSFEVDVEPEYQPYLDKYPFPEQE